MLVGAPRDRADGPVLALGHQLQDGLPFVAVAAQRVHDGVDHLLLADRIHHARHNVCFNYTKKNKAKVTNGGNVLF